VTGLSDHTLDNTTAIASLVLGAFIIEKYFTLDRNGGGPECVGQSGLWAQVQWTGSCPVSTVALFCEEYGGG